MIGTPDRKWTNNTQKNLKLKYIYRQTQNTNILIFYINVPMEPTKIIDWFNSKSISFKSMFVNNTYQN